jgi:hypothetical protein
MARSAKELENPEFLAWLAKRVPSMPIEPDPEDFDKSASLITMQQQAEQYRLAQARKLIRLYAEWEAGKN